MAHEGVHAVSSVFEIPVFPEWCVEVNKETNCTFVGISLPCLPAVTQGSTPFSLGVEEGHVWTFLVLVTIGLILLQYVEHPWQAKSSMKLITGLYSLETAFFALFRYYWGLGRPLIVGAALHNLFEWAILIHLAGGTTTKNVQWLLIAATFWILTVVAVSLMVPYLLVAFLLEQLTGILLDFGMPLMYAYKLIRGGETKSDSQEIRDFYKLPALGHSLHILFTILPLVFANFHVGSISWYSSFYLETAIYISAPMTHILYGIWAWKYDSRRQEYKLFKEKAKTGAKNPSIKPIDEWDDGLIADKFRIQNVKLYIAIGFVMGAVTLLFVPFALGPCVSKIAPVTKKMPLRW